MLSTNIVLPDALGTLTLKALVRSVRHERRDLADLWRCLAWLEPWLLAAAPIDGVDRAEGQESLPFGIERFVVLEEEVDEL